MGVWSSEDFALTEVQMTASAEHVTGPWRYERIEGVGHDVPSAAPDQLSTLLLDFLALTDFQPEALRRRLRFRS